MSHELRSPLMTLAASIEVLGNQREEMPERAQAALDLMVADIDRFQQLVEDLLEISRFDAGVARLELEEVHLAELVMQAVSHVHRRRRARASSTPRSAGVVVHADKRRLVRVIANLLDNAEQVRRRRHRAWRCGGVDDGVADRGRGPGRRRARGGPRPRLRPVLPRRGRRARAAAARASASAWRSWPSTCNLHGGKVWVEDRADGEDGARFVVELPVEDHE